MPRKPPQAEALGNLLGRAFAPAVKTWRLIDGQTAYYLVSLAPTQKHSAIERGDIETEPDDRG